MSEMVGETLVQCLADHTHVDRVGYPRRSG